MASPSLIREAGFGAALFVTSGCALMLEIVAGRLLAPYVGMSLYTWTAIIAVVLAGLSAGHWIGGLLASPQMTRPMGARRIGWALLLAAATSLASLMLLRLLSHAILSATGHPVGAIVMLTGLLFLLPSLFVGIVSPILTKLSVDGDPQNAGRVIGRMFALGALGSIFGTLAAGYLFISWIGSTGTIIVIALTYGLIGAAFLINTKREAASTLAIVAVAGGGLGLWGNDLQAFTGFCKVESDYYCIRIDDFSTQSGRPSAVMVLDHLGHGINDRDDPGLLYSPYLHFPDELARLRFRGERLKAFFIGGGAYTLPRAWAETRANADILIAEIDPAVTQAARDHLWLNNEAGLTIEHRDARVALQDQPRAPIYDVVFGDAFHDIGIPPHLVTREFHQEIAARLKPDGFYAINVVESRREPLFLLALAHTLKQDFSHVEIWLDEEELRQGERLTYLIVASAQATATPLIQAANGIPRTWMRLRGDQIDDAIAKAGVPVLTDDFAPVDRLMAHVLLAPESQ